MDIKFIVSLMLLAIGIGGYFVFDLILSITIPSSVSDCEMIPIAIFSDQCYTTLAVRQGNSSVCERVIDDMSLNFCYMTFAKFQKNGYICDKVLFFPLRDQCYSDVGVDSDSLWSNAASSGISCVDVQGERERDRCYWSYFNASPSSSICEHINSPAFKENCYNELAIIKQNVSYCDEIYSSVWFKSTCYSVIAEAKMDLILCNRIPDISVREDCILNVKAAEPSIISK